MDKILTPGTMGRYFSVINIQYPPDVPRRDRVSANVSSFAGPRILRCPASGPATNHCYHWCKLPGSQTNLSERLLIHCTRRPMPWPGKCWQKHRRKSSNDSDNHQKLNQGECRMTKRFELGLLIAVSRLINSNDGVEAINPENFRFPFPKKFLRFPQMKGIILAKAALVRGCIRCRACREQTAPAGL